MKRRFKFKNEFQFRPHKYPIESCRKEQNQKKIHLLDVDCDFTTTLSNP